MRDAAIQAAILVGTGLAIWMIGLPSGWGRWGFLVGVCIQPVWIYETQRKKQWGMLALSLFLLYSYGQGAFNFLVN